MHRLRIPVRLYARSSRICGPACSRLLPHCSNADWIKSFGSCSVAETFFRVVEFCVSGVATQCRAQESSPRTCSPSSFFTKSCRACAGRNVWFYRDIATDLGSGPSIWNPWTIASNVCYELQACFSVCHCGRMCSKVSASLTLVCNCTTGMFQTVKTIPEFESATELRKRAPTR